MIECRERLRWVRVCRCLLELLADARGGFDRDLSHALDALVLADEEMSAALADATAEREAA